MIYIKKIDESFIQLLGIDLGLSKTLYEYYSFFVENYKFMPKFKSGFWDGKIYQFNIKTKRLPIGLWRDVYFYLKSLNLKVKVDKRLKSDTDFIDKKFIPAFFQNIYTKVPRDYQIESVYNAFKYQKCVIVSPTSSGKSLTISMIIDLIRNFNSNSKILLIVPNISLIYQMQKDLIEYHKDKKIEENIKLIYDIKEDLKNSFLLSDNIIVISTWQSLQTVRNINDRFFRQFAGILVDEVHLAGAKELENIVKKCDKSKFKIGLTGTLLDKEHPRTRQITALFGVIKKVITTKQLIDNGFASDIKIEIYMLKYTHRNYKILNKKKHYYFEEIDKIVNHPERISFIANLIFKLDGISLYLFKNIKNKFSSKLLDEIYEIVKDKKEFPLYYIDGNTKGTDREMIRQTVIRENKGIIIASLGTFAQGINIPNLKNVVFAEPTKSKIKVLQSIGRSLRKTNLKNTAKIVDIVDIIEGKGNYLYRHFKERLNLYKQEEFKFEIIETKEINTYFEGTK